MTDESALPPRTRRVVAAFVGWHLLAITIGALPNPAALPSRVPRGAVAPVTTRVLDTLAAWYRPVVWGLWRVTAPLRPVTDAYLTLTGLGQRWNMFSNPPTYDEYLRVRYYVEPAGGAAPWIATELLMPTEPEYEPRLAGAFRDSYRDKAFAIALNTFLDRRDRRLVAPDTRPGELPDALAPVARYFTHRFADRSLRPDERVVRAEVWYGTVANAPPGESIHLDALARRRTILERYYEGPVEERRLVPPYPPYHAREREADIAWILQYFEEWP